MIFTLVGLSAASTTCAIEMFTSGAVTAITLLCSGTKIQRSYNNHGKNKKSK